MTLKASIEYKTFLFRLDLLHQENVWLDTLQTRIFSSATDGADAEEISEELDVNIH